MPDLSPNYRLERKKLEVQIGALRQNMLATELRQMQLQAELDQIDENVAATQAAIAEHEAAMAALPEE